MIRSANGIDWVYSYDRLFSQQEWTEFIERMRSGDTIEIDSSMYDYWLEVLPPQFMGRMIGGRRYDFGFAEGPEPIVGFWQEGERYFCQQLQLIGRG